MFGFQRQRLSSQDVERLLKTPDPQSKIETAARIMAEVPHMKDNPVEMVLAREIIERLAQDTELAVRQAVAWQIVHSPILSPELAAVMARDVAAVAFPVLRYGPLDDDILLQVLSDQDSRKSLAVAGRKAVSEAVSAAIVQTAHIKAISVLMGNDGAQISEPTLHTVLDRYGLISSISGAMARRDNLVAGVVMRLVTLVSDKVRAQLTEAYDLAPDLVDQMIADAQDNAMVTVLQPLVGHPDHLQIFIEQMYMEGRLTPSFILRALCAGEIELFRQTLAFKGRLPLLAIDELLQDRGPLGLPALMRRSGIPITMLPAFKAALHVWRESGYAEGEEGRAAYQARILAAVFDDCMPIDDRELDDLLQNVIVSDVGVNNNVAQI